MARPLRLLPRHDRISDMARDFGRQLLCALKKAEVDAAAEFTIPDPEEKNRPRRRGHGALAVARTKIVEKFQFVLAQPLEFSADIGLVAGTARVGRPTGRKRCFEARQVFQIRRKQGHAAGGRCGVS